MNGDLHALAPLYIIMNILSKTSQNEFGSSKSITIIIFNPTLTININIAKANTVHSFLPGAETYIE